MTRRISLLLIICVISTLTSFTPISLAATEREYERVSSASISYAGWQIADGTERGEGIIYNGSAAVSFSSKTNTLSCSAPFPAVPGDVSVSECVLLVSIYISDVKLIMKSADIFFDGALSLTGGGCSFSWEIKDLPLKTGWNELALSLRTADMLYPAPQAPVSETTETTEQAESEEPPEPAESLPSTPEEALKLIDGFTLSMTKIASSALTVAFGEVAAAVPVIADDVTEIEPMTDNIDKTTLIVALSISGTIIIAIAIYCAIYAKKEIKRRKREAKRRRRERNGQV